MTEPLKPLSRRWLYIPFAVAATIVLAYYLLWRAGAAEMKQAVGAWVEDRRGAGLEVSHGAVGADGFPFFLRVHIDAPAIAAPGAWRWRAARLSIDALPYDLSRLIFSPQGEQTVSMGSDDEWIVAADALRASIAADRTRGWTFSMNMANARARRPVDGAHLDIDGLIFDLAPTVQDSSALILNLAADGVDRADGATSLRLDRIETTTTLTQIHALDGPQAAAQWREARGALVISGLNMTAGETELSLAGEIAIDEAGDLAGALQAQIVNPAGLAGQLGAAGVLTPEDAEAAAAGLTLMAIAGGGAVAAPIELKDGRALIGGVKIAELPRPAF